MPVENFAYIAGPITNLGDESILDFYLEIETLLSKHGITPFIPHRDIENDGEHVKPREIYPKNMMAVTRSQLIVAYVGKPSLGTGMILETAHQNKTPVILLAEKEAVISEMVKFTENIVTEIHFDHREDALSELSEVIKKLSL